MRKRNLLFLFLTLLLFCSCAAHRPQVVNDLENQGVEVKQLTKLPGQVIVFRENDSSGFTVEYGVLRYRSDGKNISSLGYVDPERKLVFDKKDILAYFKLDVYNPTGEILEVNYLVDRGDGMRTTQFSGGNVPNSTYIFYIPIPKQEDVTKTKVRLGLENAPTFVETKELECSFTGNNNKKGGD